MECGDGDGDGGDEAERKRAKQEKLADDRTRRFISDRHITS